MSWVIGLSRHLTRERRTVLAVLSALGYDFDEVDRETYERCLLAAGIGMRDGYPDDVLEIFYKQDQMIWDRK